MKIIKQIETKDWIHTFTCSECETELEGNAGDLNFRHEAGDFRDPSYDVWSFSCPVCSHVTSIREDKIPKAIRVLKKKNAGSRGPGNMWDR